MIDQASIDRAVAYLLDVAEGREQPDLERIAAAELIVRLGTTGLEAAVAGDAEALAATGLKLVEDEPDDEAYSRALAAAFRAGARWRKSHPFKRLSDDAVYERLPEDE